MQLESSQRKPEIQPQQNLTPEHNVPLPTSDPLNALTSPTTGSVETSYNGTPLQEILNNESMRLRIFDEVCQHNFPREWNASDVREFADRTLPFTGSDSAGTLAWNAVLTAVTYATSKRDSNLSEHLLTEIGKTKVPDYAVEACAKIFCKLDSTGMAHTPELKPWVQLFNAQGTDKVYKTIRDELVSRLNRGDLSCYEHLVSALCTSKSHIGLELIQNIVKPYLPAKRETPLPTSTSRGQKSLVVETLKIGAGVAVIGMLTETLITAAGFTPPEKLPLIFGSVGACVILHRRRKLQQSQTKQALPTKKSTPLPKVPSTKPKSLTKESLKIAGGFAVIGMLTEKLITAAGQTPPQELPLAIAGIAAVVAFYRTRNLRQSQAEQDAAKPSSPPYSHMTFAEKVLRTLPYVQDPSVQKQETLKQVSRFLQTAHQQIREQSNQ